MPKADDLYSIPIEWDENQYERTLRISGGGYAVEIHLEKMLREHGRFRMLENYLRSTEPVAIDREGMQALFVSAISSGGKGRSYIKLVARPEQPFRRRTRITVLAQRRKRR